MENPFRDDGFIDRVMPWMSSVLVVVLAVGLVVGRNSGPIKALAIAVAIAVVGRSIQEIVHQRRKW